MATQPNEHSPYNALHRTRRVKPSRRAAVPMTPDPEQPQDPVSFYRREWIARRRRAEQQEQEQEQEQQHKQTPARLTGRARRVRGA
jgi:hypothetical protein